VKIAVVGELSILGRETEAGLRTKLIEFKSFES